MREEVLVDGFLGVVDGVELNKGEGDGFLLFESDISDGAILVEEFVEVIFSGLGGG